MLNYFPCDNQQLCRFGQHLKTTFQSADAIGNYLSGIRTCLAMLGQDIPNPLDRQMAMFTQGLKCIVVRAVKQAAPITPELLLKMSAAVDLNAITEIVAWTATLLGFYMFLRKSNLVPDTMHSFDPNQQFTRQDIHISQAQGPVMVQIRWSKTIQFRQRILRVPVLPAENKKICPVFRLHYMVNHVPGEPLGPTFTLPATQPGLALLYNQLIARFRKWLQIIGQDSSQYSLHSLRRGGATFAYQSNIEAEMIKVMGDWSSDAYKRHIHGPEI